MNASIRSLFFICLLTSTVLLGGCALLNREATNGNKTNKEVKHDVEDFTWDMIVDMPGGEQIPLSAMKPAVAKDGSYVFTYPNGQTLTVPAGLKGHLTAGGRKLSKVDVFNMAAEIIDAAALKNSSTLIYAGVGVMLIFVVIGWYTEKSLMLVGFGLGSVFITYGYSKAAAMAMGGVSIVAGAAIVLYKLRDGAQHRKDLEALEKENAVLRDDVTTLLGMLPPDQAKAFTDGKQAIALAMAQAAAAKKGLFKK